MEDDFKNKDFKNENNEESPQTGAAPRIIKELLRTPAFKDLITLSQGEYEKEDPREMARTILWEDAAFSFGLLGNLPSGINFWLNFLDELGIQLQNMPPHLLREYISQMGDNLDREALVNLPRSYAPLVEKLLWEDPENRRHLRAGAKETLNNLMRLSARSIDKLSTLYEQEEKAEGGADGFDGGESENDTLGEEKELDPQALGELVNSLFKWMGEAAGKDPETIRAAQKKKKAFLEETLKHTDFGLLRSAITRRAEANYPVYEAVSGALVSDPIIFANLVNVLPPLLNNLLKGVSSTISHVDFPPEILASAVFNLLDDLEAAEIAGIANGLSRLINQLHEGNMILGKNEPRFKGVLENFLEKVLQDFDQNEVAGALQAVMEDMEVVLMVTADTLAERPDLLEDVFPAVYAGFNANLRGLIYFVHTLDDLPPETYQQLGRELEEKGVIKELASLVNALIGFANRMMAENPHLLQHVIESLYNDLDKDEIQKLTRQIYQQGYAFMVNEELDDYLRPDYIGRMTNSLLVSYNRKLEKEPHKVQQNLELYLKNLDQEELSRAVTNSSKQFQNVIANNPQLAQGLMSIIYSVFKGAVIGAFRSGKRK